MVLQTLFPSGSIDRSTPVKQWFDSIDSTAPAPAPVATAQAEQAPQPSKMETFSPYLRQGTNLVANSDGRMSGVLSGAGTAGGAAIGGALGGPAGAAVGSQIGQSLGAVAGSVLDYWDDVNKKQKIKDALDAAETEKRRWKELEYQANKRAEKRTQESHDQAIESGALAIENTRRAMQQNMLQLLIAQKASIASKRGLYGIPSGVSAGGTPVGA